MRNDGTGFEQQVAAIYEAILAQTERSRIERNVRLDSPDGLREVDILIRSEVADFEFLTCLECKDYKRPVSVSLVEAFAKKLENIKAHKGIMVTRVGYSKNSLRMAHRLGIDLCRVEQLTRRMPRIEEAVPIICLTLSPQHIDTTYHIERQCVIERIDYDEVVVGYSLVEFLKLLSPELLRAPGDIHIRVSDVLRTSSLHKTINEQGGKTPVADATLNIRAQRTYYCGHLNDLPSSVVKINEITNDKVLLLNPAELNEPWLYLPAYHDYASIPDYLKQQAITSVLLLQSDDSVKGTYKMADVSETFSQRWPNSPFRFDPPSPVQK